MKSMVGYLIFMGMMIFAGLGSIAISIYGIYLAFQANVLVGIFALFVEPLPFFIGSFKLFADKNLAQEIVKLFQ